MRRIVYGPEYASPSEYPAPGALDPGLTIPQILEALRSTGFVRGEI